MPDQVSSDELSYVFGLQPKQAIAWFRKKGYAISWNWHDTLAEAHARAFTVAHVARLDVLSDIRAAVDEALEAGKTEKWFVDTLTPILQQKGWWGSQLAVNAEGGAQRIQLGSPSRLRLIYRQNLQSSMMAGRYADFMKSTDTQPYWQYIAVLDSRTRPTHAAFSGRVYRWDDPIWNTHFPPCGWNCRCRVVALTQRQVDRRSLGVDSSAGQLVTKDAQVGIDYNSGEVLTTPSTGIRITGVDGKPTTFFPDPGFGASPAASWTPNLDAYPADIARQYVRGVVTGPDFEREFDLQRRLLAEDAAASPGSATAPLANQAARASIESGRASASGAAFDDSAPYFPVAILGPPTMEVLGTTSQVVRLSVPSLIQHLGSHPEIDFGAYQLIQQMLDSGEIYQDGNQRIALLHFNGALYRAAIKATADGSEAYLLTLFKTSDRLADVQVRKRLTRLQ